MSQDAANDSLEFSLRLILIAAAVALATAGTTLAETPAPKPEAVACLAEAVYHEARGQGEKGALAVAHVIVNRRESAEFPGTVCGVITEGCQFSYRCDGRPEVFTESHERVRAIRVAKTVLTGDEPDPTGGALFFHAAEIEPGWFASRPRAAEIGGNVFYR